MFFTLFACAVLIYLLYLYLTAHYDYWRKKKVPHNKPKLLFGNMKNAIILKNTVFGEIHKLYEQYKDAPYIGFYNMRTPCLLVNEIEDMLNILNRDAQFFWKNDFTVDEEVDPIIAQNVFFQTGQKWKESRAKMSSFFSTTKVKQLTPFMIKATDKMKRYIENTGTCDGRDLVSRFVADASALAAYSIEGNSFEDGNAFFRKLGKQVLEPDGLAGVKILIIGLMPKVAKLFNLKFLPDATLDYLKELIATSLKHRKDNNINPGDFLDIMINSKDDAVTLEDMIADTLGFFADANIATVVSFVLLELANNVDIQNKLQKEIEIVLSTHGNTMTYDAIQEMQYLECVISETLRLYPPVQVVMKRCTGYYEFPRINNNQPIISVEPGMSVAFDVCKTQRDPKYFEEPDTFRPERFSEENRGNILNGTYMPFGYGKRICTGMKMANMMMKVAIVDIVRNFEVKLNGRTKLPLDYDPKFSVPVNKGGLWFDFTKRADS